MKTYAGYRFLLSTPRHVLSYDSGNETVGVVDTGRPEYYAITWPEDGSELGRSDDLTI